MTDPLSHIVDRFPENKEVIRLLGRTDSRFGKLCEEYMAVNDSLDALKQTKGSEALARRNVLRQRSAAIEEELLTIVEGYHPT